MATNWKRIRRAAAGSIYIEITKVRRRVAKRYEFKLKSYGYNLNLMWTRRSTLTHQRRFMSSMLGPAPDSST
eukprot:3058535-Heterocapsa_arctica.AAC.1